MTPDEARMIFAHLMQRAAGDETFRQALLHDPKPTLERELNVNLPPHFNIRFVENEGADLTIVLPDRGDDGRLNDEDLDYAGAGGHCVGDVFIDLLLGRNPADGGFPIPF